MKFFLTVLVACLLFAASASAEYRFDPLEWTYYSWSPGSYAERDYRYTERWAKKNDRQWRRELKRKWNRRIK